MPDMIGVYTSATPTLADGQQAQVRLDAMGRMLVAGQAASGALDSTMVTKAPTYTALGYRQVTATASAFAMPTPPAGTRRAIIQAEAQGLRWRDDGTDPTATIGMTISAGGELRYDGGTMSALKLIALTAGAIANISYYG